MSQIMQMSIKITKGKTRKKNTMLTKLFILSAIVIINTKSAFMITKCCFFITRLLQISSFNGKMNALNEVNKVISSVSYYTHRHNPEEEEWLTAERMAVSSAVCFFTFLLHIQELSLCNINVMLSSLCVRSGSSRTTSCPLSWGTVCTSRSMSRNWRRSFASLSKRKLLQCRIWITSGLHRYTAHTHFSIIVLMLSYSHKNI